MKPVNSSNLIFAEKQLSHIRGIHSLLDENDIMLVYCGEFSRDLNKTLLSFTERKFKADNVEDNIRRKIFNIMVEVLQNISKNKIEKKEGAPDMEDIFLMGAKEEYFLIISSNLIMNNKILHLKNNLDHVNSLGKDELKRLYNETRLYSSFSTKSGAGIGIIDIARKSENKLEYNFCEVNSEYSIFSLMIKIHKQTI